MATVDFSDLRLLCKKALKEGLLRHYARSAEYFCRAVEAARMLQQPQDCWIVACMQVHLAEKCIFHAQMPGVLSSDALVMQRNTLATLDEVIPVLQRRKNTSLRAPEIEFALMLRGIGCSLQLGMPAFVAPGVDSAEALQVAGDLFFGTYMLAAQCVMPAPCQALMEATRGEAAQWPELAPERWRARYDFIGSALDYVMEFGTDTCGIPTAMTFILTMKEAVKLGHVLSCPVARNLAAAWERLQHSGLLNKRSTDSSIARLYRTDAAIKAAAAAELAARGLRGCALAGCPVREVHVSQFKSCAACKTVVYCCKEHQVEDWPQHKSACKAARKASASTQERC